jgi:hypothetical protein
MKPTNSCESDVPIYSTHEVVFLRSKGSPMAYRKTNNRSSKSNFRAGDYVPTWNQSQTDTVNLIFKDLMERVGVRDITSFFEKLWLPVIFSTAIGSVWGAYSYGFGGFIWGAVLGASAPAWLLWLGICVGYALAIAGVYLAAWAAIIFGFFWLVGR